MPKDATPPDFADKTFTYSHITAKFAKAFSPESFLLNDIGREEHPQRNWKTLFDTKRADTYKVLTYNEKPCLLSITKKDTIYKKKTQITQLTLLIST